MLALLGAMRHKLGILDEAEDNLQAALAELERVAPPRSPILAGTLLAAAELALTRGHFADAAGFAAAGPGDLRRDRRARPPAGRPRPLRPRAGAHGCRLGPGERPRPGRRGIGDIPRQGARGGRRPGRRVASGARSGRVASVTV